jgi:peptide/nickel transport system permease protein
MGRFILKRLGLACITLTLVSFIVFILAQLLPGNIGRAVLGGFATQESVDQFNHEVGLDRPLLVRYWDWISHFARGDFGQSYQYRVPVSTLLGPALLNSAKLAAFAFVMIVPISVIGGVIAALRRDRATDRVISVAGLSVTAIPEFVTAVVLIVIFGIWIRILPVSAAAPQGANFFQTIQHLILPGFALALVYFGYLSRMTRAGMIEALDADYTRTAYLKGLTKVTVIRRHVLRNALLPTIAVLTTQLAFLVGGLLVIEKLFNYNGIGQRLYTAAQNKDFPIIQSGAMLAGTLFVVCTLVGDILYSMLNPRIRFGGLE